MQKYDTTLKLCIVKQDHNFAICSALNQGLKIKCHLCQIDGKRNLLLCSKYTALISETQS